MPGPDWVKEDSVRIRDYPNRLGGNGAFHPGSSGLVVDFVSSNKHFKLPLQRSLNPCPLDVYSRGTFISCVEWVIKLLISRWGGLKAPQSSPDRE
jgi:hypothetical protein